MTTFKSEAADWSLALKRIICIKSSILYSACQLVPENNDKNRITVIWSASVSSLSINFEHVTEDFQAQHESPQYKHSALCLWLLEHEDVSWKEAENRATLKNILLNSIILLTEKYSTTAISDASEIFLYRKVIRDVMALITTCFSGNMKSLRNQTTVNRSKAGEVRGLWY